jgi:hypothetical protein
MIHGRKIIMAQVPLQQARNKFRRYHDNRLIT